MISPSAAASSRQPRDLAGPAREAARLVEVEELALHVEVVAVVVLGVGVVAPGQGVDPCCHLECELTLFRAHRRLLLRCPTGRRLVGHQYARVSLLAPLTPPPQPRPARLTSLHHLRSAWSRLHLEPPGRGPGSRSPSAAPYVVASTLAPARGRGPLRPWGGALRSGSDPRGAGCPWTAAQGLAGGRLLDSLLRPPSAPALPSELGLHLRPGPMPAPRCTDSRLRLRRPPSRVTLAHHSARDRGPGGQVRDACAHRPDPAGGSTGKTPPEAARAGRISGPRGQVGGRGNGGGSG